MNSLTLCSQPLNHQNNHQLLALVCQKEVVQSSDNVDDLIMFLQGPLSHFLLLILIMFGEMSSMMNIVCFAA